MVYLTIKAYKGSSIQINVKNFGYLSHMMDVLKEKYDILFDCTGDSPVIDMDEQGISVIHLLGGITECLEAYNEAQHG